MLSLDDATQKRWGEILFFQSLINEGGNLPDPMKFSKYITELMAHN